MSFKTDMGRVIGLGSAGTGAEHWLSERLKSAALIPLTLAFFCIVAPLVGGTHAEVVAAFQNPIKALAVILFFAVTMLHLKDGLQVVIEDYVHAKGPMLVLLLGTKLLCWAFGIGAIFAVAKIAFAG